ncbi:adenylosuccinate lyase [Blochmannia endosymbiont of Polyrhachis (Hedomyrma) turneri]|uniref:adenylosuccinate lyase n=1 Tax=Blochmannia endosymbiont of Polyrhachis (Hedomyrma) turneri TaxID=1505596 RepID=UPI00061A5B97|nr:adenylosuccinate lyase [Blochmannia endosymbiont of Polyrhachis (Hedomyrma) turneri]AKC59960.1 Adenylosuccinate lyase [Blochmannia endosymbiont of Polyrhachis (Hedomyrma) turneri]
MELSSLTAISPIDGRYEKDTSQLRNIFSEFGLLKYRVQIEIRWLQKLAAAKEIQEIPCFNECMNNVLNTLIDNFSLDDAKKIKEFESLINHDLKSVEYFLKEKLSSISGFQDVIEFVHFACTSDDINNLAYALMLSYTRRQILLPMWKQIIDSIKLLACSHRDISCLSRTHGQPATPSTVGKEMANFFYRLIRQYRQLEQIEILGKINGSVGNYNAHMVAYSNVDWHKFSKEFVTSFEGVSWNPYTTQIEPHDYIAEFFSCVTRFNTILIDFNRDIWGYVALGYFKQYSISTEIGSSVMPHKINPINFEKSEGNLGLANVIMNFFSSKLPISRWQRDLSDSTVLRNIGVGVAYSLVAYRSSLKGIDTLKVDSEHLLNELNQHWIVIAEAIQTVMRRYGIKGSYEMLKEFTKGRYVSDSEMKSFIDSLPLPILEKERLKKISPDKYIGYAKNLVDESITFF